MDERRDLALAKRLAKAMGMRLVPERVRDWSGWALSRYPYVEWTKGSGSVLWGSSSERGLLDMCRRFPQGKALPSAVWGCSSDEELELVLSSAGF